jgi:cell division protein FtsQ
LLAGAAAVLAGGYLLWFRDSSLVAVNDVEVAGVSTDREAIVSELTRVGEGMTTLHVDQGAIERAATAFPTVKSVSVDANFPHGLRIEVAERPPAVIVNAGGDEIPAAADGTLLPGASVPDDRLPTIEADEAPAGKALAGEPLEQTVVAGAAPEPLRPLIEAVSSTKDHGVEVTLRGDLPVYFGDAADAAAKWASAAAVMADPKLDYARCVDVRIPARPAVCQDGPVTEAATVNPPA